MPSAVPPRSRREYGQFCAVSSALDVVGERWTLLIVRDLLLGPKRYTDLRDGLPGIGTDLLTARLRTLEAAGLVRRRTLPRPAPATVYELTERGALLAPVVKALARLGFAFLGEPADGTEVLPERVVLAMRAAFEPEAAPELEATYRVELGNESFGLTVRAGELQVERDPAGAADLSLRTEPVTLVRLLQGRLAPDDALASGALRLDGERAALDRFLDAFSWERDGGRRAPSRGA